MIGKTIAHYKILEKLGQGGMGVVYKAEDTKLKRTVALKFTPPGALENDEDKARFRGEAQAAAALDHPNICTIYEINDADDQTFIAMKYISGRELRDVIREGSVTIEQSIDFAAQVATALQEAHDNGIVHRDIKSANVMVTDKGRAVVMDFGLAKQLGSVPLTKAGTSLGTIDYMSPEQAQGQPVDHRTDLWSLGVMLYEMVAGRLPFKAEFEQAVIYSIVNQNHDSLATVRSDAPPELSRIVDKAMAKDPNARYQSAAEMLDDLHALGAEMGVSVGAMSTASRVASSSRGTSGSSRAGGGIDGKGMRLLGAYAIVGLAIFGVLQFLVNRFPLSPNLPNFGLIAVAAMFPIVILMALFGSRGSMGQTLKRVGVPLNLLGAALLLFFVFQDRSLGAATTTVTVSDEAGNSIERVIPKSEFRKRVALFYFDNKSPDTPDSEWIQYGVIHALRFDLYQDLFLTINYGFEDELVDAGFEKSVGAPMALKRRVAKENHYPYFVAGEFEKRGSEILVNATLYDTKKGSPVTTFDYRGVDLFAIVDSLSLDIRKGLGVPDYHIAESIDLPVSELLTKSQPALASYSLGREVARHNDIQGAATHLENAVAKDPSFSAAYWTMNGIYLGLNRSADASKAMDSAMEHRYKLPEQVQFNLRNSFFRSKDQQKEAFENAKRWATLYPQDVVAHDVLSWCYEKGGQLDEAIAKRQDALAIDPARYNELREIARINEVKGDFVEALNYRKQYAELFPEQTESLTELGRLYQINGDLDQARSYYKEALVIEPNEVSIYALLSAIERSTGNFDEALKYCQDALRSAKTDRDSTAALGILQQHYTFRGQGRAAAEVFDMNLEIMARFQSPVTMLAIRLFAVGTYVLANDEQRAFSEIKEIESGDLIPQLRPLVSAGYLITYGILDDPTYASEMEAQIAKFDAWVQETNQQNLAWVIHMCRGHLQRWNEEWEAALSSYQQAIELLPQNNAEVIALMNSMASDCCLELGRIEQGRDYAEAGLTTEPYNPYSHTMLAEFAHAQGDMDTARLHLQKALYVYEVADPDFRFAKRVRELEAEWNSSM